MKPIFDFELAAKLKREFEEMNSILDYFKTPTLDALSEKARELNGGYDLENKEPREPYYDPKDLNTCPMCFWNPCDCSFNADEGKDE